ncbi:MAG: hypothetical protein LBL34_04990 [Clostridiales bacterium]|nr:hypothetical protein [Clostridiales bacterium]
MLTDGYEAGSNIEVAVYLTSSTKPGVAVCPSTPAVVPSLGFTNLVNAPNAASGVAPSPLSPSPVAVASVSKLALLSGVPSLPLAGLSALSTVA